MTMKERETFYDLVQDCRAAFRELWVAILKSLGLRKRMELLPEVEEQPLSLRQIAVKIDLNPTIQRLVSALGKELDRRKRAKRLTYTKSRSQRKNFRKWGRKR